MVSINKREIFLKALKYWFEDEKRDLPWRKNHSPYRVWVSEVMLQQTRASVVIPYFERWMKRFPTIEALAEAEKGEVIKLWEGLGYYSRARSLHDGARYLVRHHGGELPADEAVLKNVKGIGPYTIGAILSFAFHKKAAAIDGNVLRVMARFLGIEEEIDLSRVKERIQREVFELLPDEEPWVVMEALIELGAQVCKPKASCFVCPLREDCEAYALGKVGELPKRRKRSKTTILHRDVYVIEHEGAFLIQKQGKGKIMAGLCEFPYIERGQSPSFFSNIQRERDLNPVTHTFTRYKAHLYPSLSRSFNRFKKKGLVWVESKRLSELAFSSGHRKILKQLLEVYADLTH